MRHTIVIIAGCALAFGATVALGGGSDDRWLSVGEFLALFAMLTGLNWLFKKWELIRQPVSPLIIGAFAVLFVIYVSWSVQP